jgi:hypothetical protein
MYKSRRDSLFNSIFLLSFLLLIGILIAAIIDNKDLPFSFGLIFTVIIFLLLIYFRTDYRVEDGFIYYRSGIFKGSIKVDTIRELEVNTTQWVGNKPALARKGIIIKYNKYDDIYVSPERQEEFIQELLAINPQIKVVRH